MILRFMTKRNTNGYRKYLALNTDNKTFCTRSPYMILSGEEITTKAMRNIKTAAENDGFTEVEPF